MAEIYFKNIQNLSIARYASGNGAAAIWFNFDQNANECINFAKAKEIASWISGPIIGGEFNEISISNLNECLDLIKLDFIVLPFEMKNSIDFSEIPIYWKISLVDLLHLDLDFKDSNFVVATIDKNWFENKLEAKESKEILKQLSLRHHLVFDFIWNIGSVKSFLEMLPNTVICVNSIEEKETGLLETEDLEDIIEFVLEGN